MSHPLSFLSGLSISDVEILREFGFEFCSDLINLQPSVLVQELKNTVTAEKALQIIQIAKQALINTTKNQTNASSGRSTAETSDKSLLGSSALNLLHESYKRRPIFSCVQALDSILGKGLQPGELTEICGSPGLGKTQFAIQFSVCAGIPECYQGAAGQAIYIDSEGSFMPERVVSIANGLVKHLQSINLNRNYDISAVTVESLLRGIHVFRVYDYIEQLAVINSLGSFLSLNKDKNIRVIVIDSIAFHFRRGFKDMAERQRLLSGMAQTLLQLAEQFNLAVLLINQVTTKLGAQTTSLAPALGESWAHAATNRIMLYWDGSFRTAKLIKSPHQRQQICNYTITQDGVRGSKTNPNNIAQPITASANNSINLNSSNNSTNTTSIQQPQLLNKRKFDTIHPKNQAVSK
jgi:RAD51-like protein 2